MKKQIVHLLFAVLCILMVSCNDTMEELNFKDTVKNDVDYHGVPLEIALAHLDDFLASLEEPMRSDRHRRVSSVNVVRNRDVATRSVASVADNVDSLIYVVNFEDNQGFAYLAADDRISEPVIFVSDSGSFPSNGFGGFTPLPIITPRPIYPGYPLEGPGTFYSYNDSTGKEELYMNPNTFVLHDSDINCDYVGDFFFNEEDDPINQINNLTFNFIDIDISQYADSSSIYQNIPLADDPNEYVTVETTSTTSYSGNDEKLLNFAKNWSQRSPFNNLFPMTYQLFTGKSHVGYAGCVPLAVAKIFAYHKYPNPMICLDYNINWNKLRMSPNMYGDQSASHLLKYIAEQCVSIIVYEGTFTFPYFASLFMSAEGYTNVLYKDYNSFDVKNMIDNGNPILVCSVPHRGFLDYDFAASHAWNIDGYKTRIKHITKKYYKGGYNYDTEYSTEETMMVHCDWGWRGMCNGYFATGVFNLGGSGMVWDNTMPRTISHNYNWYIKIITYDNPN